MGVVCGVHVGVMWHGVVCGVMWVLCMVWCGVALDRVE